MTVHIEPDPLGLAPVAALNALSVGALPGLVGFEVLSVGDGSLYSRLTVRPELLAPNGYLHAATVVALADTSCGYGCRLALPASGTGFTTIEIKANFLGTARSGGIECAATLVHGGRTTQVWDATVTDETAGNTIALFRCTQLVLYSQA